MPDLRRTFQLLGPLTDEAFVQLRAGWRQQVLTLLGIVWGAAVVILLLSLGAGFYQFIDLGFKKTGDRYTSVDGTYTSTERGGSRPGRKIVLEREDVERIRASVGAAGYVGAQFQRASVAARTPRRTRSTVVCAATPDVRFIKVHEVEHGRYFDEDDDLRGRRLAVLGFNLVSAFFGDEDPLGRSIQLDGVPFRVVGTLRHKGAQLSTNNALHDDMIFIPMRAGQRLFDIGEAVGEIMVEPMRADEKNLMHAQLRDVLYARHRLADDEDQAVVLQSMLEIRDSMARLGIGLEILLGFIGTMILAMAGAGVANLMTAIVSQRRSELAMRRAFGARRNDLVLQLLVETLVVVLAGGALGAALSFGLLFALSFVPPPDFIPLPRSSPSVVITTMLVLLGVGLVSGIAPARVASRVDPAAAMRVT